jgi:hypothetical protein
MIKLNILKTLSLMAFISLILTGCNGKLPGGDARKNSPNPEERVKKNLEEGRGFQLKNIMKDKGGVFEFASSNELWRASLDVIDFMPLVSVNYSGGIIVTDWYLNEKDQNESIKISIRFLTNEIRSDALSIKVFTRRCEMNLLNCKYLDSNNVLVSELKKEILKKATIYRKQNLKKPANNNWTSDPKKKTE